MTETVLTSRRGVLLDPVRPGRLRVSDRTVRFEPLDGEAVEVPLTDVRRIALGRTLVVDAADATLRLRCFGLRGVALLLAATRAAA